MTEQERDAWDFVEKEKPNFTLAACVSPLSLGPTLQDVAPNPSGKINQRVRAYLQGAAIQVFPPIFFVDSRDAAMSLVLAAEKEEAAGKRFLIVAGKYNDKQIMGIIGHKFPQFRQPRVYLPTGEALETGNLSAPRVPDFDNRRSVEVLGMRYRSLAESIEDAVKSLQGSFIRKPGSMLAQLEQSHLESPFIAKMAIMLAHEDPCGIANVPACVEPLPHIDYHLVYSLIALAGRLDKRQLKPFDYLIDARKSYYRSHSYFQAAFVCLQDAQAYGQLLEKKYLELEKSGSAALKELESTEIALRRNYRTMYHCLGEVESRRKKRERTTTWFSKMKYIFIKTQMPRLIFIGKKTYQRAMELQGRPIRPKSPVAPLQNRESQTEATPPQFESLSGMLNTDMSEEDLLHAAARINNHA
ncbi:methylglyoxal reductase (NADPH-dependent) gre2 [Pseudocyphellaria aurata]|nr:methylglyoxal reductase (NADPH-dependent) gre2 [Pseudocyphellaria aurata]